jgi:hypothetical protein
MASGEVAGGAGAVLDGDRLTDPLRQRLPDQAREIIRA